jgi:hypothetical protein
LSDTEFLQALRARIADGLKEVQPDLRDYLIQNDSGYDELREVVDELERTGQRVLMLWDRFDSALHSGQLSRSLWDNLLELCRMPGFRLVTATRRKLQELLRDAKSVSIEFWQVFDVVRLPPLDDTDIQAFSSSREELTFTPGALTELANWSGGIPPLLVWLLNRISAECGSGTMTNEHVNRAATKLDERLTDVLDRLWSDCPAPAADLFRSLVEQSACVFASAGKIDRSMLMDMGLAIHSGDKLHPKCRFMSRHIEGATPGSSLLGRLFGAWEDYQMNIRSILERRLAQIERFDETLFHMVEQGIQDIPQFPNVCLQNLSHIEDRAFDLVWAQELGADRRLPDETIRYWTESPRGGNKFVRDMMDADRWELPRERGPQLALLQLLTGSHQDFPRAIAKHASKDTYVLLNAIHSFRNRAQHADGQVIPLGVAVTAIMLCIELLGCLACEFPRPARQ